MRTYVRKWGNSLALRIPKSLAAEAQLVENVSVELSFTNGHLIIQRAASPQPTLAELLREVTDENIHGEWDTGPAVGKEFA